MLNGVWFPTVRTHTGTDVFTEQLASGLEKHGIKVAIDWLPLRAEYAPWSVKAPIPPCWARIAHVNSWLSTRFIPKHMMVLTTIHHSIHDPNLLQYKGVARALYHRYWIQHLEAANLERADSIVAVSADAALLARKVFGLFDIKVIHNGVDSRDLTLTERSAQNSPFRLLYVGTWMTRKGVDLFERILRELGPSYELLCIGGEPGKDERANFPGNIKFLGRISDRKTLVTQMQQADALLFPSRSEGLSLSLIEAQICGLPAICASCSSMPEVVLDGETGILCPVDEVGGFVNAARHLANNLGLWKRMRLSAHLHATEYFSLDRQVSDYMNIYM